MNIPDLIRSPIAQEGGRMTPQFQGVMNQIITELQTGVGKFSFNCPQLSALDITAAVAEGKIPNGGIVYDTTNNLPKIMVAGTLRTISFT